MIETLRDLLLRAGGAALDLVDGLDPILAEEREVAASLARHGWRPPAADALAPLAAALPTPAQRADLRQQLENLRLGGEPDLGTLASVAQAVGGIVDAVRAAQSSGGTLASPFDEPRFWQTYPSELAEELIAEYLELMQPALFSVLHLGGVIETVTRPAESSVGRRPSRGDSVSWQALPKLLTAPGDQFAAAYGWRGDIQHPKLLDALQRSAQAIGAQTQRRAAPAELVATYFDPANPALRGLEALAISLLRANDPQTGYAELWFMAVPIPERGQRSGAPRGLWLGLSARGQFGGSVPLTDATTLTLRGGTSEVLPPGFEVLPSGPGISGGAGPAAIDVGVALDVAPREPWRPLGAKTGARVEIDGASVGIEALGRPQDLELRVRAALGKVRVFVDVGDADSFVQQVVSPPPALEFETAVTWSSKTGVSFEGEAAFDLRIPLNVVLGPVELVELILALRAATGSGVSLDAGLTVRAALGPAKLLVQNVGTRARLADASSADALVRFDQLGLAFGFKPPDGAALSIDSGAVTGGGFLFFDPAKEQYAGGLHLEFEKLTLNAIGLLTTRMPDGSRGFSLLVIVQASGFTPIQLGFGFTLNGVGGLLGINRTVAVDVLRAGVRNRTLDAVLFSRDDPTPRASQIVSTLQTVFPPAPSQYVFGPMALIGWGTPTLITIEVALILELPKPLRLIVLGRVRAALPDQQHAIVSINLDVVGVVDFDRSELSVDASLYDSKVGPFALSGDMAARASWGSNPDFAMALGGFHPAFKPPPGFPELRRLALALSTGNNPRLRMEAYFALTSNTVQVGARLELYVEAAGFSLEGGLGFDTLIQFSPFQLLAEIYAHLALKRGGTTLMGLDIHVHLTGPAPWVIWGEASFTLFIITISIPFRATFGRAESAPAIERKDVWPVLRDNLLAEASWSAQLPPESGRMVVLSGVAADGEVLVHPLATLTVTQRLVPLDRTLDLFGSVPPRDFNRFSITGATGLGVAGAATDYFAPAQFRQMSDAERLASPSFERMTSGAELTAGRSVALGYVQETPLDYEQSVILAVDQPDAERLDERYEPGAGALATLAENGPAATATLRDQGRAKFAPDEPGPKVAEPRYAVATKDGLDPVALDDFDGTFTAAAEKLRDRADRDELQIVREEELAPA